MNLIRFAVRWRSLVVLGRTNDVMLGDHFSMSTGLEIPPKLDKMDLTPKIEEINERTCFGAVPAIPCFREQFDTEPFVA